MLERITPFGVDFKALQLCRYLTCIKKVFTLIIVIMDKSSVVSAATAIVESVICAV